MRIEATAQEIRDLLALAAADAGASQLSPEAHEGRWQKAAKRVSPALLRRYRTLVEAGRSPAVVAIQRATCSGCNIRLPTMVESLAKRVLGVYECPHCHRMIYTPEHLGETKAPSAEETHRPAKRGVRLHSHA